MAKVKLLNLNGEKVKDLTLNDKIWNIEINDAVLYDAITFARAGMRQGTAKTKTRAEVSGGGRKPWKQKGTGRARQGSTRSPQWRGGGIVFGPTPRDYSKKMNKKERKLAMLSILSSKYQNKELIVVENFDLKTNKTKDLIKVLENLKANDKTALIVTNSDNENLVLAARNNKNLTVVPVDKINVLEIAANTNLIIDENGVKTIEEVLK